MKYKLMLFSISWVLFSSSLLLASEASVFVKLTPAGDFTGKTSDLKGEVVLDAGIYRAKQIVVNLKDLKTGLKLRDEHTQKYLETQKYPEAILVSAEGSGGKGKGLIRIKGIEKAIEGTYSVVGKEFQAEFPLSLKDFNITGVKYMGVGVSDQVKIKVNLPLQAATNLPKKK